MLQDWGFKPANAGKLIGATELIHNLIRKLLNGKGVNITGAERLLTLCSLSLSHVNMS